MSKPEAASREIIDATLSAAGSDMQDALFMNLYAFHRPDTAPRCPDCGGATPFVDETGTPVRCPACDLMARFAAEFGEDAVEMEDADAPDRDR